MLQKSIFCKNIYKKDYFDKQSFFLLIAAYFDPIEYLAAVLSADAYFLDKLVHRHAVKRALVANGVLFDVSRCLISYSLDKIDIGFGKIGARGAVYRDFSPTRVIFKAQNEGELLSFGDRTRP